MKVSAHIVTAGRETLFQETLLSVLNALPEEGEVWVVVNGDHPKTVSYLQTLRDPRLNWRQVKAESLSDSRNRGFELCGGDVVYFLDDDVTVPTNLFSLALMYFAQNDSLAILGGPNLTPPGSAPLEQAFGEVMANWFAAPLVFRRYRREIKEREAGSNDLIFCNLALRRALIPKELRFLSRLSSNQENLFLHQARASGLHCLWSPFTFVFHRRRKTLYSFFGQVKSYGRGRVEQTLAAPLSCHPFFLVPAVACLFAFASVLRWQLPSWMASAILIYGVMAGVAALQSPRGRRVWVFFLTPVVHLAYGLGTWEGMMRETFRVWSRVASSKWSHQKLKPFNVS